MRFNGEVLLPGNVKGEILVLTEPLSFWGGVNPQTGQIVDVHHPQIGEIISDKIIFLPGTKGSTAGPGALVELIYSKKAPLGIVLTAEDSVCVIAGEIARSICNLKIPIIRIDQAVLPTSGTQGELNNEEIIIEQ